jgi:ribonuclease BN (tRNA processing enzyme)
MKLVLLGTNGFHPTDDGQTACYMFPELGIVLDTGSGLCRISKYLQTPSLDIYLSHAHSDHYIGLKYLFGSIWNKELTESRSQASDENMEVVFHRINEFLSRVCVHAAEPTLTDVQQHQLFKRLSVGWLKLETQERLPGDGILTHFALDHTIECCGFRLDWPGHSLAYVTDTVAKQGAPYIERIKGVDILLHDCYLPNRLFKLAEETGHSCTMPVAQVAAKAEVGRLILIHHNTVGLRIGGSELVSAREVFPSTEIGLDGMEVEF